MHPSHEGHIKIGELLIENIFPEKKINYEIFDDCEVIKYLKMKKKFLIIKFPQQIV